MNATRKLHDLGQSLWLDNITRDMLDDGTLERVLASAGVDDCVELAADFDQLPVEVSHRICLWQRWWRCDSCQLNRFYGDVAVAGDQTGEK